MKEKLFLDKDILFDKKYKKQKIYIDDIKFTLKKLKLNHIGKKPFLLNYLLDYYNRNDHYNKHLDKIISIQNLYRDKLTKRKDDFYSQFINSEDFYTLDSIRLIEQPYLFWFNDNNNFKFAFDIRSFKNLLINNCKNPYNREDIPQSAISKYKNRIIELKKQNIKIVNTNDILTKEQERKLKIVRIFQKLDELNIVAGGINQEWFNNFTFYQLKNLYKVMEDIWNYRSELSMETKHKIVTNNNVFTKSIFWIMNLTNNNYFLLQDIVLNEIETLISSSNNIEDKQSGGYYVLIALTEVSLDYGDEYPWLKQS
jgi:hypothetical protein